MYISIISFFLVVQSLIGGQPDSKKAAPSATDLIFQSADGGQTWQDITDGLPKDFQVGIVYAGSGEVFLSSNKGLYHSIASPSAPNWEKQIYPGESIDGIFPGQAGPYAFSYNGGFFQEMQCSGIWLSANKTFTEGSVSSFLETKNGIAIIGSEGGIFKSTDGMITWKHVYNEDAVSRIVEVDGVLIGCSMWGLIRSTDGGDHWDKVQTGEGRAFQILPLDKSIAAICAGSTSKPSDPGGTKNSLLISTDSGKTWIHADEGLPQVRNIYDIVQVDKYLICSLDTGIFRSSDQGRTWEHLSTSMTSKKYFDLAVTGHMIYAVKVFNGC